MSEGHVYLCTHVKEGGGFNVWVEKRPKLSAQGETLDDALDELSNVLCLNNGDGEAVFQHLPEGKGEDAFVAIGWKVTWSPIVGADRTSLGELFEGGLCRSCCSGVGSRTKKLLSVGRLGEGDILGSRLRLPKILLVSERFRKLLTRREQSELRWKPIDNKSRSKRLFFEVQAKRALDAVADRNQSYHGWHCPECKLKLFSVLDDYKNKYICASDVPIPRPKLLTVDDPHSLQIALPLKRWKNIRGQPGSVSGRTKPVVELPAERTLREPKLKSLTPKLIKAIDGEFEQDIAPP